MLQYKWVRKLPKSTARSIRLGQLGRWTYGAAGLDLVCTEEKDLQPMERYRMPTGIIVALPEGHVGLVVPRSGHAGQHGITVLNSPGTIDADYRGEVHILLINLGSEPVKIKRWERIAQLLVVPIWNGDVAEVEELDDTERGQGGFGSTGQ